MGALLARPGNILVEFTGDDSCAARLANFTRRRCACQRCQEVIRERNTTGDFIRRLLDACSQRINCAELTGRSRPSYRTRSLVTRVSVTTTSCYWLQAKLGRLVLGYFSTHVNTLRPFTVEFANCSSVRIVRYEQEPEAGYCGQRTQRRHIDCVSWGGVRSHANFLLDCSSTHARHAAALARPEPGRRACARACAVP